MTTTQPDQRTAITDEASDVYISFEDLNKQVEIFAAADDAQGIEARETFHKCLAKLDEAKTVFEALVSICLKQYPNR
jgi:non-ribosomal peptide synthetase component E (peptide arylation enzyme)